MEEKEDNKEKRLLENIANLAGKKMQIAGTKYLKWSAVLENKEGEPILLPEIKMKIK